MALVCRTNTSALDTPQSTQESDLLSHAARLWWAEGRRTAHILAQGPDSPRLCPQGVPPSARNHPEKKGVNHVPANKCLGLEMSH